MNRWIESRSSERVRLNLLASSAIFEAYESCPTRSARTTPDPATTNEPDSTSDSIGLSTGSASPVRSDSSSSRPLESRTIESTSIWSPVRMRMTSSTTISCGGISTSTPSRRTVACCCPTRDSFASVRAARYSCVMPMAVLMTITRPNRESMSGALTSMSTQSDPMSRLK